jgi:glycosyltransferase involved in cell wall biosynthesis
MDNTHLRFFDKKSIIKLFNESGYSVQALDCVRVGVEQTSIKVNQELYESARKLVHDDAKDVFQYVVLTKPAQSPETAIEKTNFYLNDTIKVLCVLPSTDSALAKIRIIDPLRIWAKQYNGLLRIRQIDRFGDIEDVAWADVVVLQREANVQVITLINYLKKLKKKIIFDLDDLLTQVPSFLTTYKHALRTKGYLYKVLRMCDVITVTNQRLQNELMRFNANVVVIPNCSSMISNNISQNENDGVVNLIIAHSDTIRVDFIIPVLKRITQQTEFKFNLIGIGPPGKFIENAGIKIELHENMPHESFKKFLTLQKNAIGLIPLDDSKFSSCKSAIKFIDFSLSDVVSICSDVSPYSDTVINGKTGILVNNDVESWYNAIIELGKSKEYRFNLAKVAKDYCLENFALDKSAEKWQELFLSLNISKQKIPINYLLRQNRIYRANLIISHAFDKSSYLQAIVLFKKYGLVEFTKRFFRYLKRK